ncbi:MAG: transaldolase [Synergistaceae bacterium]|jgi:transaldolase|nr:transaldolase [Synergistaceae bacterium]
MMRKTDDLKVKIFMDGADIESIKSRGASFPFVKGFTTNPTLMRKAGVGDYQSFAKQAISAACGLPISFEVFSDEFDDMGRQARIIASWGPNAYVKIPVTNSKGESSRDLIKSLSKDGISLNVTAILTLGQVKHVAEALDEDVPAIVSVFAGRIADTGRDPVPVMKECLSALKARPNAELLWASPRELLNIVQADEAGCHIITATPGLISKLKLLGKDLEEFSLETVRMFRDDAVAAGFLL